MWRWFVVAGALTGALVPAILVVGEPDIGRTPDVVDGSLGARGAAGLGDPNAPPGCELAAQVPDDTRAFTPVESQHGTIPDRPLIKTGIPSTIGAVPVGMLIPDNGPLPIQLVLISSVGAEDEYEGGFIAHFLLAAWPVTESETAIEFIDRGGIIVTIRPTRGADARYVLDAIAEMGHGPAPPIVQVAEYEAALIHSDPTLRTDLRPYYLYWSDSEHDYSVVGDLDRVVIVNLARSLHCG